MSTNFPTSKDDATSIPVESTNTPLSTNHITSHTNVRDSIIALETKVGVDGSAVTTSHDYKLSGVTGTDKAVSKTGTETLTNKTLTSPVINLGTNATGDMYYRDAGGAFQRLPIGTAGQILDVSAGGIPEWIANPSASPASYSTAGVATTDANVRYYAADAGSNDSYAITLSPAPTAYVAGQTFHFKANTINTGAATLNVNSLGAKTIVKGVNTTLADGDIAAGMICTVVYDGTNFILQNPTATQATRPYLGLYKNGTTTKTSNDASTTQNIAHGLGVIPKRIKLTFLNQTSNVIDPAGTAYVSYNGTTCSVIGWQFENGAIRNMNNSGSIVLYNSVESIFNTGVVTFDATNIIITWTLTGAGGTPRTFDVLWEAEA